MQYKLGSTSLSRLSECHDDLQLIVKELAKLIDITVLCGYRGKEDQNKAYREKKSKLQFPKSKHNLVPALAVDIAPLTNGKTIEWNNIAKFNKMLNLLQHIADDHGVRIRLGRDFSFRDYPHVELDREDV